MTDDRIATVQPDGHDVDDIDGTSKRHPAAVTIERLERHSSVWFDQLTPKEIAAIDVVVHALGAIERGER